MTFVENICSDRTYTRYLNGTRNISHNSLVKLCAKLGIRYHDFYHSYQKYYDEEYSIVNNLYNLLIMKNYNEFNILNKKTVNLSMVDAYNERYLTYINIRAGIEQKNIQIVHGYELLKQLKIDINKESYSYDFVDILVLIEMLKVEETKNVTTSLHELNRIIKDESFMYMSASNKDVFPAIYSTISLSFGRLEMLEESIYSALEGIKYSIKVNSNEHLSLLYYLAFCYYNRKQDNDNIVKYSQLCISNAFARQNINEELKFKTLIKKDSNYIVTIKNKKEL